MMSFCYSFRKQDVPFEKWIQRIDELVVPADPGEAPEGVWRELLVSNMVRESEEGDKDYYAHFLTEGSIRGVAVIEEGDEIMIKLYTFASRGDQYLAARLAWEAMNLGAAIEKEGYGVIAADALSGEALEATHREWFSLSKRSGRGLGSIQLPVYGFLSLKLDAEDVEKEDDVLEKELVARIAAMGDAFLSSLMTLRLDGGGERIAGILQPSMRSLITKDAEVVAVEEGLISAASLVEALGGQVMDGHGCWIFPPVSEMDSNLLRTLIAKGLADSVSANDSPDGPTEEEWKLIGQGPVIAFLLVAAADGNVDKKEVMSFQKTLIGLAAQQQHDAVARMMKSSIENLEKFLPEIMAGQSKPMELIQSFTALVNARFNPQDAKFMKTSLLYLAQEVASSSGGFLGLGPKISKDEKMALAVLATLLGLVE